ncbi:MAG: SURF1 family protein, partial [Beijerinckiaceae bacterium]
FVHACEFPLFTPLREGAGWTIITAFQREGDSVPRDFVMRGVVPDPLRDAARRIAGQVKGPVTVTGRLRADHLKGGSTVLPNEPDKNRWYSRDVAQMAAGACGGMPPSAAAGAPAFFIEYDGEAPPGGWPRPDPAGVQLVNNHLQYAITWFALAGVLVIMFGYWLMVQRRERPKPA